MITVKTLMETGGQTSGQSKAHFTLIELLVVIAIIAILAAILLPALNSARQRSFVATCHSNLKQLGMGVETYADEWDDYLPPAKFSSNGFHRWHYKVNALLKGTAWDDSKVNEFPEYFRCPAFQEYRFSDKFPSINRHLTYGMNNATGDKNDISTLTESIFVKRNKVKSPTQRPLLADFYRLNSPSETNLNNASQTAWSYYSLSGETATEAPKHYIHGQRANVSFVDGHVSGPEELTVGRWPKKLVQFHSFDTW